MNIGEIMRYLPHRYPFLLIDRVLEFVEGESIVALKNVTMNEPFFQGHFPHHPVMPGVLILEAMAQAAGVLAFRSAGHQITDNSVIYFAGLDAVRFKRPVVPGDQLIFKAKILKFKRGLWVFSVEAFVDETLAAQAELMCTIRELAPE